jgi:hypothetical protein
MLDPEFVLDAVARERLLDRFGPDAEPWCDGLAGLVAAYCRRWGLELDEALSGGTSRVFLGRQDDARPVVLKLTPDRSIAESEAAALRAWARTPHAVDLLASEPEAVVLLLDRVTPGTKAGRDRPPVLLRGPDMGRDRHRPGPRHQRGRARRPHQAHHRSRPRPERGPSPPVVPGDRRAQHRATSVPPPARRRSPRQVPVPPRRERLSPIWTRNPVLRSG